MQEIREYVAPLIQIIYAKMKSSPTMEGFLDTLRQLLDELEYAEETREAYSCFNKKLSNYEVRSSELFPKACRWIDEMLSTLSKGSSEGAKEVARLIESDKNFHVFRPFHIIKKINLLRQCVSAFVKYGDFSLFKEWGSCNTEKQVFTFVEDPLQGCKVAGLILPDSKEGVKLRMSLGHGFIEARLEPSYYNGARIAYTVSYGVAEVIVPDWINDFLCADEGGHLTDSPSSVGPVLLLKYLVYHACWREWMAEDVGVPSTPSDTIINSIENTQLSQEYFTSLTSVLGGNEELRAQITNAVDRFLILVLEETYAQKMSNRGRAIKYAYGEVKKKLLVKSHEQRRGFTYDELIELIMNKTALSGLFFHLTRQNCRDACELFAKSYGWLPKKKKGQARMVASTRRK